MANSPGRIILIIVLLLAVAAVIHMVRHRGRAGSCSGNCSECALHANCEEAKECKNNKE